MTRNPDGVTTATEVWNWLQRHRRPIPPQPWTRPAFRVVDSTVSSISYLVLIRGGRQLRAAFIPATLALRQDWRSELARLIRGVRMQVRLQLSRADALRYAMRNIFPLPDYREPPALVPTAYFGQPPSRPVLEALATGYGLKASDMLTGAQPTLIDDLLAKASSRAAALVAQHTDAQIRAGLIKLGWTPPPGTTNTTKGE